MTWCAALLALVLVASPLDQAAQNILRWRAHPEQFAYEHFGFEADPWQLEAFRAFADPTIQRISLFITASSHPEAIDNLSEQELDDLLAVMGS